MKVSTRAHYGLRAVIAISEMARSGLPVSVSDVAKAENLSDTYLEQLVSKLRRAGILRSYRGARGGYELVRDPDTITVAEVLRAAGEQIVFPECTTPEGCELAHQRGHVCASSHFWQNLNFMVNKIAEETTVGSLIRNYEEEMEKTRAENRQ
ncbi:RrF2 family transcriptional regulator [Pyramidobacter sp.]|uniref:RrF2 family transcriptional regulator n=1 Tax=Pyramidobacter sp. TaxID=1943581 RepID=UPI0025CCB943|nr:Rrf2 family transcriptional regulator [Pyramidobacter sp.]MCI7403645.1 Rrf2 family transcriptional regulator [Pyramidobacter sp.]MDY3212900.1 Rrf2 family transcriptional regulator [Pyramidobacter sp.]